MKVLSIKDRLLSKESFFHNISILFLCNILVNLIGLFINMYLARVLKPEGYGEYGLVLSWGNILLVFSSLGIQQVAIRSIAQHQDKSAFYFWVSFAARLIGYAAVAILFSIYFAVFINKPFLVLPIILLYTFVLTVWDGIQNLAFGMQRMEYTGYINLFGQLSLFVLYIIIPKSTVDVIVVLMLMVAIGALKDIGYYFKCKRERLFKGTKRVVSVSLVSDVKAIVKESFPFFILSVFTLFTTQFPVLFLDRNAGVTEVAYFNTANKVMVPMTMMLNTIMVALFPNLSKDAFSNPSLFLDKIIKILTTMFPLAVYICCLIALFRNEIVYILFGDAYKSTGVVMSTQCWYIVMNFLFCLFGNVWAATKHDKLLSILSIVYACVNTPILWYTSRYGATIMSCGYIIGAVINMTYHYGFFLKTLNYRLSRLFSIKLFTLLGIGITFSFVFPVNISLIDRSIVSVLLSVIIIYYLSKRLKKSLS